VKLVFLVVAVVPMKRRNPDRQIKYSKEYLYDKMAENNSDSIWIIF
jgi:hypothetical protein